MADEVKIPIVLTADTAGGEAVAATTREVTAAIVEVTAAGKGAAAANDELAKSADAVAASQTKVVDELKELIETATRAGADTSALRAELAALQKTAASRALDDYRQNLQDTILATQAAGGNTRDLVARLASLPSATGRAAAANDDLAKSAGQAAASNTDLSKSAHEFGENASKGAAAGRVFAGALSGDLVAFTQLAPAIKVVSTLLKTSLIGTLVTLGTIAASIAVPFIQGFIAKKKAIDDTTVALDAATRQAEALGKVQMDALHANIDSIRASGASLAEQLKLIIDRAQQLEDANRALETAKNEGDTGITEEERVKRRAAISTRYDAKRAGNQIESIRADVTGAENVAAGARGGADNANAAVLAAQARVDEINRQRDALLQRNNHLSIDPTDAGGPINRGDRVRATAEFAKNQRDLDLFDKSDEGKARRKAATEALAQAEEQSAARLAESIKADQELTKARERLQFAIDTQAAKIPIIQKTNDAVNAKDLATARAADLAAGRVPAPAATPAAAPRPILITDGSDLPPALAPTAEGAARTKAGALGAVASGAAAQVAGDSRNAPGLQILGAAAQKAAEAIGKDQSIDAITKAAEGLLDLARTVGDNRQAGQLLDIVGRLNAQVEAIRAAQAAMNGKIEALRK